MQKYYSSHNARRQRLRNETRWSDPSPFSDDVREDDDDANDHVTDCLGVESQHEGSHDQKHDSVHVAHLAPERVFFQGPGSLVGFFRRRKAGKRIRRLRLCLLLGGRHAADAEQRSLEAGNFFMSRPNRFVR